jgi:hypothetical protein
MGSAIEIFAVPLLRSMPGLAASDPGEPSI